MDHTSYFKEITKINCFGDCQGIYLSRTEAEIKWQMHEQSANFLER